MFADWSARYSSRGVALLTAVLGAWLLVALGIADAKKVGGGFRGRGAIVGLKVVDVRKAPLYYLGHIDGALHVDRAAFLYSRA